MAMDFIGLSVGMGYTDETVIGGGALKGKNCVVRNIEEVADGVNVTFQSILDDGTVKTDTVFIPKGTQGEAGVAGKSAYEVWLEAGNTGTEQDFLISLVGEKGADGKSAYQYAQDGGYIGTETEFTTNIARSGVISKELEVERARIDNLTTLQDGSTTGDAELLDIRVGYNGKVYESAGESVRGQIEDTINDIEALANLQIPTEYVENVVSEKVAEYVEENSGGFASRKEVSESVDFSNIVQSGYYATNGILLENSATSCFEYKVKPYERYKIKGTIYAYMNLCYLVDEFNNITRLSNENPNYGSVTPSFADEFIIEIPSGGCKLLISYMNNSPFSIIKLPIIYSFNDDIKNTNNNFLDKLIVNCLCIGDSTTQGYNTAENMGGPVLLAENYPYYLGKIMNCDVANGGDSGQGALSWFERNHSKYDFSTFDTFIINFGTNYGLTDTIESDTSSGDYSTYGETNTGAYCKLIETILNANNNAHIYLSYIQARSGLTNVGEISDFITTNNVIEKIGAKYNLPILDDRNNYKVSCYQSVDNLHFTKVGNLVRANTFYKQMINYISGNLNNYNNPFVK